MCIHATYVCRSKPLEVWKHCPKKQQQMQFYFPILASNKFSKVFFQLTCGPAKKTFKGPVFLSAALNLLKHLRDWLHQLILLFNENFLFFLSSSFNLSPTNYFLKSAFLLPCTINHFYFYVGDKQSTLVVIDVNVNMVA